MGQAQRGREWDHLPSISTASQLLHTALYGLTRVLSIRARRPGPPALYTSAAPSAPLVAAITGAIHVRACTSCAVAAELNQHGAHRHTVPRDILLTLPGTQNGTVLSQPHCWQCTIAQPKKQLHSVADHTMEAQTAVQTTTMPSNL